MTQLRRRGGPVRRGGTLVAATGRRQGQPRRPVLPELAAQTSEILLLGAAPYLRRIVVTGAPDRRWATRVDPAAGVPPALLGAVEAEVSPADLAIMIHTSGSTADPKGVLHTPSARIPTLPSGKLDRKTLRARIIDGALD